MQEWFDREYSAKVVYGRLFRQARRYSWALVVGIVCGMLVGGTWVPVFQMLQPLFLQMQAGRTDEAPAVEKQDAAKREVALPTLALAGSGKEARPLKFPGWFKEVERTADRFGVKITDDKGGISTTFILTALFVLPLAFVFRLGMLYLNNYALQWAGIRVVRDLRNEMFDHLQDQSLKFFGRMDVGRILSRCGGDPGTVQNVISITVAEMCRAPFEILAAVGFVIYFAVKNNMIEMIALTLIGYPLTIWPLLWIGKKIRRYARVGLERGAVLGSNMLENVTGIRVVKAYHMEEAEKQGFRATNQMCVKVAMRGVRVGLFVGPMIETATILLSIIFFALCYCRGKTIADIIPLITPFVVAYKPLKSIGKIQASIESGRAALTRIYSFLDLDMSLPLAANPIPKKSFEQGLAFEHVDFAYGQGGGVVVKDVNFALERGRTVAVVGSTGSGKTTLANLMARFYDPTGGRVLMDGIDLRDLDMADLRALVGMVTQETILFNRTIAENIAYGVPGATQEQIEAAAQMANAHAFILQHPEGYKRIVGDKGFVLSGGERQRVAIARAILRNPPILILDEATSALDTVTEQQVQEAINRLMRNRTVFVIAHRLSTVRNADTILVLDHGVVVERGSHAELYEKGGVYRRLCDVQKSTT